MLNDQYDADPQDPVLEGWAAAELEGEVAFAACQTGGALPSNPYTDERAERWAAGFSFKRWEAEGKPKLTLAEEDAIYDAGKRAYRLEAATKTEVPNPYDRNCLNDVLAAGKSQFWASGFYDAKASDAGDDFEVLGEPRRVVSGLSQSQ